MKIKSFKLFNEDTNKDVVFTFGRYNPPTTGHGVLFDKVASVAKKQKAAPKIYASQSQDSKKNPLDFNTKIKAMRKMFPKHARAIVADKTVKNALQVASALYSEGYRNATMVVGSDRVKEFEVLLNKYNGKEAAHGYYNFENGIKVVSAGARDPDAEGVEGMSASKMRRAASANDYELFKTGLPVAYKDGQQLFNDVRKGMGLKESVNFLQHIKLEEVSQVREDFVKGELFTIGQSVTVKETKELGEIYELGGNYVSVQLESCIKRFWLEQIVSTNEETK
jgi:hypothetical protein